jgi:serine protease Do
MGALVGRLFKAGLVVVPSMVVGVLIGIAAQAGFLGAGGTPLIGGETISGRWITPFDSGTAHNRSALFDEEQMRRLYEAVAPSIVSVTGPSRRGGRQGTSSASGIVIDTDGHVLTNNHVVEGLGGQIEVVLAGGQRVPAEVLGRDPGNDLAVLKVDVSGKRLPVVPLGDSALVRPGDLAIAIGNPAGMERAITVGVISGLDRTLDRSEYRRALRQLLQTDAAINPGNSGGPLLNIRGEVVGINTAIISDRMANAGVGFAVPINTVRELLDELRGGKVTRGVLGIGIADVEPDDYEVLGLSETGGVAVNTVTADGPADQADVRPGDVVVAFNGDTVSRTEELQSRVVATRPGTTVPVDIIRNGERLTLQVTIGELDEDAEIAGVAEDGETSEAFGIALQDLTPQLARRLSVPADTVGAVVTDVARGSNAAAGGLQPGDVILSVNRLEVASAREATDQLNTIESGRRAFLLVQRRDTRVFLQVEKN